MSLLFTQLFIFILLIISDLGIDSAPSIQQDTSRIIEVTIHPYKSVTHGAFSLVMVLSSPDCYVEYLHGFDFKWGHQYRVRLKETTLGNPPIDGSSLEYKLLAVLSDSIMPSDYSFTLWLSRDLYLGPGDEQESNLSYLNDSTYLYMDQVNLTFGTDKKVIMEKVLLENKEIRGHFTIVNEHTIGFE